jgi:nuclear pore complex protein Nup188
LITVEILELEGANNIELSDRPERVDVYYSSPETLKRLHDLVTSHSDSQYSCTYLSWTYVLSRLCAKAAQMPTVPASYQSFFDYINPPVSRSYTKEKEPIPTQMARACLDPEVGLFGLIESLLANSPLFVTAVAWRMGSSVTDPNAIAYRSVLKGLCLHCIFHFFF